MAQGEEEEEEKLSFEVEWALMGFSPRKGKIHLRINYRCPGDKEGNVRWLALDLAVPDAQILRSELDAAIEKVKAAAVDLGHQKFYA